MLANPALIGLAETPVAAILAAVQVGAGLAAVSFGVIAPWALWQRGAGRPGAGAAAALNAGFGPTSERVRTVACHP